MLEQEQSQEICKFCGQPDGSHASDCSLVAVHEEYEERKRKEADYTRREGRPSGGTTFNEQMADITRVLEEQRHKAYEEAEGITPEFKKKVKTGEVTFDNQMAEVLKNIQKEAVRTVEHLSEVTQPSEAKEGGRPTELEKAFDDISNKALTCFSLIESMPDCSEKQEMYYDFINIAKKIEYLRLQDVPPEGVADYLLIYNNTLDTFLSRINNLLRGNK